MKAVGAFLVLANQRLDSLPDPSNPFNHHQFVANAIVA
jgi:hypothetical protein